MGDETILLTGAAGFIGWETAKKLLAGGKRVLGVDNLNDYYDVRLKEYRLEDLKGHEKFSFYQADIEDLQALDGIFRGNRIDADHQPRGEGRGKVQHRKPFRLYDDECVRDSQPARADEEV